MMGDGDHSHGAKGGETVAYSELIKNFEKIRGYLRGFYVYGFRSRTEYDAKSARSYDNERRRIESWLGDYMSFRQNAAGKTVFLSADNRGIPHNPLYKAFKAKSFTDNDITLHFHILDMLADGEELTLQQIEDLLADRLARFDAAEFPDESTVRNKLKEYERLGLLVSGKQGRAVTYRRSADSVDLDSWRDAAAFFSESDPMGVVGSYLLDRLGGSPAYFSFKHHYLLHAMDSEILCALLDAIREKRRVELSVFTARRGEVREHTVLPLRILISTQSGRQYLMAWDYGQKRHFAFRIDNIRKVKQGEAEKDMAKYSRKYARAAEKLWGVSTGDCRSLEHVELTLRVGENEGFILERLEREKRSGRVEIIDGQTCRYTADVYDTVEMLPWIRTFIGRIVKFECDSEAARQRFYEDLEQMRALYGGDSGAVQ